MNFIISCLLIFPLLSLNIYAGQEEEEFIKKAKEQNSFNLLETQNGSFFSQFKSSQTKTDYSSEEINYSKENWIKARQAAEDGTLGRKLSKTEISVSTSAENEPSAPPPQLEFTDSGTSLSITGRKIISLNYSGKKYLNEQTSVVRPKSSSLFDITQQMQIRMQGKVGEKISVNVDYDDTKTDKQDISVVYQGNPNETVQNISFGDIDLSLPATEFVSYNKQLFGIRADIKTNRLKFTFIGSRTKGQTKTRQFIGNTQFQSLDILDTNYIRRKYYDISFGNSARLPIKAGSEKIYIDRQTGETVDGIVISSFTADDLEVSTVTHSGRFRLLTAGVDYVMDYVKGIIIFNTQLNSQDAVVIDFVNSNGSKLSQNSSSSSLDIAGTGRLKILKTSGDIYISSVSAVSELGWKRELKTYYAIGQTNIVRDDGKGNFKLSVQDLNRNEVGPSLNPPQRYPDTVEMDFEQGVFNLKNPFASESDPSQPDPQVYAPSPISKRVIRVEYSYRLKTFTLEPNIVLNSEIIKVDGKKLTKNQEYYIDYDSGFITFYYPERINSDSVIDIVYDVSASLGTNNQSMVGARASYDLSSKVSLGATVLYQGNVKAQTTPNISELASSLLVYESDIQFKNLNLLGLKTSLSAEIAASNLNPNLNDYAVIDNMEGIKQEDYASMDHTYWKIASNPSAVPSAPNAVSWNSYEISSKDINPNSPSDSKQRVLEIKYDLSVSSEVSIVYPFSSTGLDFSQKTAFEMIISGDSSNNLINVKLGQINEDSDGSGGMTLMCSGGSVIYNAPKTEDLNCDGQLSPSEDKGWIYAPSGYSSIKIGENNGRIDTQDLNGNGRLDFQDFTGSDIGYVNSTLFKDNTASNALKNHLDFTGWHTWIYPMVISSTEAYKWSNIKQMRLTIKKAVGGANTGTIRIARAAAVGNSWNISASTSGTDSVQILAVNNIDNSDYVPIYSAGGEASKVYSDLYGSVSKQKSEKNLDNISEQSLQINYSSFYSTSTSAAYRRFSKPIDISNHKKLKFLVYSKENKPYDYFYLKFGDFSNYFKAKTPLNFTGWRLISIDQIDLNSDNIPETWTNASNYQVEISSYGSPSLSQISSIIAGVETSTQNAAGIVYLNELHVSDPIKKQGKAEKLQGDFEIAGLASFGGKYRFTDKNFQTPVSAVTNQDNEQETAYLNLSKPSFFPTNYTFSRQVTKTPNTYQTGSNNLVNFLQQGKVEKIDATASGTLDLPLITPLNLNYSGNRTDYVLQARKDKKDSYSAGTSISSGLNIFIIPKSASLNYSYTRFLINYDSAKLVSPSGYYDTDERTENYSAKLSFSPFFGTSINPGYTLSKTKEERVSAADFNDRRNYPKSMSQTAEISGNVRAASWFNPSFNYSATVIENNNLSISTVIIGQTTGIFNIGDIKTVTRNSQGSVNLTLNMNDLLPKNRSLRSLIISSSYQLQDGDVWNNVERGFNTQKNIWIRKDIKPQNPFAYKNSQTSRDTYSSSQRWQPFEGFAFAGRLRALSSASISNNFNFSKQRTFSTGTISRTKNMTLPDLIFTMGQIETLTGTQKWIYGGVITLKHSQNISETISVSRENTKTYGTDLRFRLLNFMDSSLSYNFKIGQKKDLKVGAVIQKTKHQDASVQGTFDINKFRFTPKIDYSKDYAQGTLKTVTQDVTQITPSILVKTDIQTPKGMKLPFFKDTVIFTNRIIWTNTLSYTIKKSPITQSDNNRLLSLTSVADYEASKNLRISLNASIQRFWHKYLKQEEYLAYQAGTTVTLQF
ncbi:MAG: hypothetical protein AB1637_01485 [Elusimicrobiota bacterium]